MVDYDFFLLYPTCIHTFLMLTVSGLLSETLNVQMLTSSNRNNLRGQGMWRSILVRFGQFKEAASHTPTTSGVECDWSSECPVRFLV